MFTGKSGLLHSGWGGSLLVNVVLLGICGRHCY